MDEDELAIFAKARLSLAGLDTMDLLDLQRKFTDALIEQRDWFIAAELSASELTNLNCLGLGHASRQLLSGELLHRYKLREHYAGAQAFGESPFDEGSLTLLKAGHLAIVLSHRGLLGTMHVAFNRAMRLAEQKIADTSEKRHPLQSFERVSAMFRTQCYSFSAELENMQKAVHQTMIGQTHTELHVACTALVNFVESQLPIFARALARAVAVMQATRHKGQGGSAERLGRQCVEASTLLREALASHVSAILIPFHASLPSHNDNVMTLQGVSSSIEFDYSLPHGKDVQLAHLHELDDGEFVQLRAFVKSVSARRLSGRFLISELDLQDPSSGATAEAVAIFAHLPHAGITSESFVDLSGTWSSSEDLLEGRAALRIDALALTEHARKSWKLAFLKLAEPWFSIWPNGANITFSLAPQRGAVSSEDPESQAVGELVFRPWLRV